MTVKFTALNTVNDEKGITAAIDSLHKRAGSLQLDVHRVLVAVAVRWATSGDVRPVCKHLNHLLTKDKLGGMRKNAIRAWVEHFMQLKVIEEGDNAGDFYAPKGLTKGDHLEIKELTNKRWWEFTPEKPYQPLDDPRKLVAGLIKKLETDRAKMGKDSKVDVAMIEALKAVRMSEVLH